MKWTILMFAAMWPLSAVAQPAAPPADWKDFAPLIGEWVADPSGEAGSPVGGFVLEPSLQGRVLVRKNWAKYPRTEERSAFRHDDLMVIYRDGTATRADYYDNEGHVIHYLVSVEGSGTFVFLGDAQEGRPRFRLTNSIDSAGSMTIRFDIAAPISPNEFKPYITAKAHRKRRVFAGNSGQPTSDPWGIGPP